MRSEEEIQARIAATQKRLEDTDAELVRLAYLPRHRTALASAKQHLLTMLGELRWVLEDSPNDAPHI
jgi:hypothetical protein